MKVDNTVVEFLTRIISKHSPTTTFEQLAAIGKDFSVVLEAVEVQSV